MSARLRRIVSVAANYAISVVAAIATYYFPSWGEHITSLETLLKSNPTSALTLLALATTAGAFLIVSIRFAYKRRIKTKGQTPLERYFEEADFAALPFDRLGYSDRFAYTMAELSDIAYLAPDRDYTLEDGSTTTVNDVLAKAGFGEARWFEVQCGKIDTQGFVTRRGGNKPYIVVAFRGSEANVEDWLTNADAKPTEVTIDAGDAKITGNVHSGFLKAYQAAAKDIDAAIAEVSTGASGVPIFYTGHSLGGALAMIAVRIEAPDSGGACYTYGSPRVGDYPFYKGVKTPIYRVVNAADIVPRVPPGIWSYPLIQLFKLLGLLTRWCHGDRLFKWVAAFLYEIRIYRHYGDLRYLPDMEASTGVATDGNAGRGLHILNNPNNFDMIQWFYRHIMISFGLAAVKSHSMRIYREKLLNIARDRMNPVTFVIEAKD